MIRLFPRKRTGSPTEAPPPPKSYVAATVVGKGMLRYFIDQKPVDYPTEELVYVSLRLEKVRAALKSLLRLAAYQDAARFHANELSSKLFRRVGDREGEGLTARRYTGLTEMDDLCGVLDQLVQIGVWSGIDDCEGHIRRLSQYVEAWYAYVLDRNRNINDTNGDQNR